jgi:hypothetical protein
LGKVDGKKPRGSSNSTSRRKIHRRYWQYVFEANGNAIGDFNMIDANSGLIIERDNGEGTRTRPVRKAPRRELLPDLANSNASTSRTVRRQCRQAVRKIAISIEEIKDPTRRRGSRSMTAC